jgi:hypothetical protein
MGFSIEVAHPCCLTEYWVISMLEAEDCCPFRYVSNYAFRYMRMSLPEKSYPPLRHENTREMAE